MKVVTQHRRPFLTSGVLWDHERDSDGTPDADMMECSTLGDADGERQTGGFLLAGLLSHTLWTTWSP